MLEIRYTKPDAAPWIDMIFAPFYVLIGFSFLSKSDFATPLADQPRGFWLFALLGAYALIMFIRGLISWRVSRVGRLYCRIDADGLHFFDRAWYTLWRWGEVDFVPWRDIETIARHAYSIEFTPRSWLKRFIRHVIRRINLRPQIIYRFADKKSDKIIAAIRKAAPGIEIATGKTGRSRLQMKL